MRKEAYIMGREMVWSRVGRDYAKIFDEVRNFYQKQNVSRRRRPMEKEQSAHCRRYY